MTAIVLNLFLNYWGGPADHDARATDKFGIDRLNAMPPEEFVNVVGPAYQGSAGIADHVAGRRPFADANELRAAMQDRLFALSTEQQLTLMEHYPTLAARELGEHSIVDQAAAGLTFLSEEQQVVYDEVTAEYQKKFGFPLIVAVREVTAEQVVDQAWIRLDNSSTQEHQAALLEIAKIANHRLADVVEGTEPMELLRLSAMAKLG